MIERAMADRSGDVLGIYGEDSQQPDRQAYFFFSCSHFAGCSGLFLCLGHACSHVDMFNCNHRCQDKKMDPQDLLL